MKVRSTNRTTSQANGTANDQLNVRAIPIKVQGANGGACHNPCNIER